MKIENFNDLDVWKKAHQLILQVYVITQGFPKEELYGITSQLRRAASSINANIAEGFSRYHFKDKIRFYYQARGSASEVHNYILLSKDLRLIKIVECKRFEQNIIEVKQLINGLIRSIENQI